MLRWHNKLKAKARRDRCDRCGVETFHWKMPEEWSRRLNCKLNRQPIQAKSLLSLLCAACNFERQRVKAFVHQLRRRSFTVCCWNSADFEQFQHLSSLCNLCLPKGQTVWPLEFSADFLQSTNYGIAHQTRISHRLLQIYGEDSVVSQACKACLCCKAAELSWKLRLAVWPKVFFHWFLRLKLRFHGSSVYIFFSFIEVSFIRAFDFDWGSLAFECKATIP